MSNRNNKKKIVAKTESAIDKEEKDTVVDENGRPGLLGDSESISLIKTIKKNGKVKKHKMIVFSKKQADKLLKDSRFTKA